RGRYRHSGGPAPAAAVTSLAGVDARGHAARSGLLGRPLAVRPRGRPSQCALAVRPRGPPSRWALALRWNPFSRLESPRQWIPTVIVDSKRLTPSLSGRVQDLIELLIHLGQRGDIT